MATIAGGARARGRPRRRARRRGPRRTSAASTTSAASPTPTSPRSRRRRAASAVTDAVLLRIAEAAAEVGLDDTGRARPRSPARRGSCERGDRRPGPRRRRPGARLARRRSWSSRSRSRIALARRIVAPWIMVDEIVYSELAKSFAAHGHFLVRGVPSRGYGFVYPVLIAPAWRLFARDPERLRAPPRRSTASLMSLAAIPAYFLARRLLPAGLSLVAAALDRARPLDALHGDDDDRERLLPAVPAVALLLVRDARGADAARRQLGAARAVRGRLRDARPGGRAARRRSRRRRVLLALVERRAAARRPAPFAPLYAIARRRARSSRSPGTVAPRPLAAHAARRLPRRDLEHLHRSAASPHYLLYHVAELDLYLGVIPFAALLALWLAPRRGGPAGAPSPWRRSRSPSS